MRAIELIDAGRVDCRFVDGHDVRLHAKIYCGTSAATLGSSNFTRAGLSTQVEANTRFTSSTTRTDTAGDADRVENYSIGDDWNTELADLLVVAEVRVVVQKRSPRRAPICSRVNGPPATSPATPQGGVVAVATPRYRPGAVDRRERRQRPGRRRHRVGQDTDGRAPRTCGPDRLWSTGRVRRDLTVLVCPPAVEDTWYAKRCRAGSP